MCTQEVNDIGPSRVPILAPHIHSTFLGDSAGFRRVIAQVKGLRFGARHDGPAHELLQNQAVKDHSDRVRCR
jgi:hypothetical protein